VFSFLDIPFCSVALDVYSCAEVWFDLVLLHDTGDAMQTTQEPELRTLIAEAARIGVSPQWLREAAHRGKLKVFRVGNRMLVRRADVDRFIETLAEPATSTAG
jgi:excisionase family DNA binding protein